MRSTTAAAWVATFLVGTTALYTPLRAQTAKATSPAMATAQPSAASTTKLQIPVEYYKLPNGLRVVVSDYQETRNVETIAGILPNTRTFTAKIRIR